MYSKKFKAMTKFDYYKINCCCFETCLKQKLSLGDDLLGGINGEEHRQFLLRL